MGVFSGCTLPPDSKDTELGSSNQETFPSACKDIEIVLVPSHAWKHFQGFWVSFVTTDEFSVMVTKITSRIDVS